MNVSLLKSKRNLVFPFAKIKTKFVDEKLFAVSLSDKASTSMQQHKTVSLQLTVNVCVCVWLCEWAWPWSYMDDPSCRRSKKVFAFFPSLSFCWFLTYFLLRANCKQTNKLQGVFAGATGLTGRAQVANKWTGELPGVRAMQMPVENRWKSISQIAAGSKRNVFGIFPICKLPTWVLPPSPALPWRVCTTISVVPDICNSSIWCGSGQRFLRYWMAASLIKILNSCTHTHTHTIQVASNTGAAILAPRTFFDCILIPLWQAENEICMYEIK